jgi:hypothetical protein
MAQLQLDHHFDAEHNRHYINNQVSVLHCHHYATLFTQLAIDAKNLVNGVAILQNSAEEVFYKSLTHYFQQKGIGIVAERLDIACQLFTAMGLGKMEITNSDPNNGDIVLPSSHVDQGWLKKWGKNQTAVNFITAGYIAAAWAASFDQPPHSYTVLETQSIVCGASTSCFKVSR